MTKKQNTENNKTTVLLDRMRRSFLDARFEAAFDVAQTIDWPVVIARAYAQSPDEMTAVSMSSELFDYFGDVDGGRQRLVSLTPMAEQRLKTFVDDRRPP